MSIVAMNWAMKCRTDGPSAQIVLYVIADTANEHGLSRHADPDYIASRSRQSRGTVFRRLQELEGVGALTRIVRHLQDGRRSYNIQLHIDRAIDYETPPQKVAEDEAGPTQHIVGESQIETQGESPVIQGESHSCNSHKESVQESVLSPTPFPSGKGALKKNEEEEDQEFETQWAEFRAACYPDGIIDIEAARREMCKCSPERRRAGILGLPAYADYLRRRKQKSKAAHLYWKKGLWEGLSAAVASQSAGPRSYPPNSHEGRAILTIGQIARYELLQIGGQISFTNAMTVQILAFASVPLESEWHVFPRGDQQFWAWWKFVRKVFDGCALRELTEIRAPWPWPPSIDGKIYSRPPGKSMAEQDAEFIQQHGLG